MGRNLRVYHNLQPQNPSVGGGQAAAAAGRRPYSLIMEQRGRSEVLVVENYAIVAIGWISHCQFTCASSTVMFA